MKGVSNFEALSLELYQEVIFDEQNTLIFDIQNVFLTKVDILDPQKFKHVIQDTLKENYAFNYILVENKPNENESSGIIKPFKLNHHVEKLKLKEELLDEIIKSFAKYHGFNNNQSSISSFNIKNESHSSKSRKDCCLMG